MELLRQNCTGFSRPLFDAQPVNSVSDTANDVLPKTSPISASNAPATAPMQPYAPQPTQPFTMTASATAPAALAAPAPVSAAYKIGLADGQAYLAWANSLKGDYKAGSDYWASVRSVPSKAKPGCNASGVTADFVAGCKEAASRLALFDRHRLSDPDYKAGWTAAFAG